MFSLAYLGILVGIIVKIVFRSSFSTMLLLKVYANGDRLSIENLFLKGVKTCFYVYYLL